MALGATRSFTVSFFLHVEFGDYYKVAVVRMRAHV